MSIAKREAATHPISVAVDESTGSRRPFLKVYLPAREKAAFAEEAAGHGQDASEYARFILGARSDPLLFLQLARLLHPGFAAGLMGNPTDAGRVAELEKRVLELTHQHDEASRERDEALKTTDTLERELAASRESQHRLASYVADLARAEAHNRARALEAGGEVEAVPRDLFLIVKVLSASPGLHRDDLQTALITEGLSQQEARDAILGAERDDIIRKGKDRRYRLAKPPTEGEEE